MTASLVCEYDGSDPVLPLARAVVKPHSRSLAIKTVSSRGTIVAVQVLTA
jgi:hypothetical protein